MKDFFSGLVADVRIVPSGPVHTVLIVTGTSTAGFNSAVQVRVNDDSDKIGVSLGELECRLTVCSGTVISIQTCMHQNRKIYILEMLTSKDWLLVFATGSLVISELAVTWQMYCPASDSRRGEKERLSESNPTCVSVPLFLVHL